MAAMFFIGTRLHANGRYYIHTDDCPLLPSTGKRIFLGISQSRETALEEGKKYFNNACCCKFCLGGDHTKVEGTGHDETLENNDILTDATIRITSESVLFCGVN
jgi:hypothetical protein